MSLNFPVKPRQFLRKFGKTKHILDFLNFDIQPEKNKIIKFGSCGCPENLLAVVTACQKGKISVFCGFGRLNRGKNNLDSRTGLCRVSLFCLVSINSTGTKQRYAPFQSLARKEFTYENQSARKTFVAE
mgnify:CR=1 FL=1